MKYQVVTLDQREDLVEQVAHLDNRSWPTFLQFSDAQSWSEFYETLSDSVLILLEDEKVIAAGFTVPVQWDQNPATLPETIEAVLQQGIAVKKDGLTPNTLIPIGALVDASVQGKGLSSQVLIEMKALAHRLGLRSLVVPVRPTKKAAYPLQSIHSYAGWRRADGLLYDPWLRVHEKLGAEVIHIAECTLTVKGAIADWQSWTQLIFPESGNYTVPAALSTVAVDVENDIAIYQEPNVWMLHPM
uniref:hypothetical protein n=1 Tax=Thaumasiovibrio occultus TaxID=1891184 RepID=UPI000B35084B|nr:hypothetical protein [Thaumasiovibrio occultus]